MCGEGHESLLSTLCLTKCDLPLGKILVTPLPTDLSVDYALRSKAFQPF